jgi:hypothetical protein
MSEIHTGQIADRTAEVHHETSDINIRGVFAFGIGLTVTAIVIYGLIWLLFAYFAGREARQPAPAYPLAMGQTRVPPEPRLQTNPRQDLRDLRTTEETTLTTYGWVDKNSGTVRIPIDRAMQLTVERGLPARQGSEGRR